jgi:HK97 gp10 family phage protein
MAVTLTNRFPAIIAELNPRLDNALERGAERISARAKVRAPDAPPLGEGLVDEIGAVRDGRHRYRVTTDWKAHFLEYGTVKMSPRPFLVPAFEETRGEILADVMQVMSTL